MSNRRELYIGPISGALFIAVDIDVSFLTKRNKKIRNKNKTRNLQVNTTLRSMELITSMQRSGTEVISISVGL